MIVNRSFQRPEPFRETKKREPQYFKQFSRLLSRIQLHIIPAEQEDNNSPLGLFQKAKLHFE